MASPFRPVAEGLRIAVRLQPGASRNLVEGLARLDDGTAVIRARVTAPPEGGRANALLIALLAKTWKVPKRDLEIAAGAKERRKSVLLKGDSAALLRRLENWLEGQGGA